MDDLIKYLDGGDLRTIVGANKVVSLIKTQSNFDKLFQYLFSNDRLIIMRTADAIEKITTKHPEYLTKHKNEKTRKVVSFLKRKP